MSETPHAGTFAEQQPQPELTVKTCEETGHAGHFARITAGHPGHSAPFCLSPREAAFLSQALAHAAPGPQHAPGPAAVEFSGALHFERKQVLSEIFTCLAAGDPALLDDEQVSEWRERAGMEDS